jgi:hypothetical protein
VPTKLSKINLEGFAFQLTLPHDPVWVVSLPRVASSQVLAELGVASVAWRILVTALSPVKQLRRFFSARSSETSPGCGDEGNRTPDLLLAKQALYQLSYAPDLCRQPCARTWIRTKDLSFIRAAL